jgi:predicted lipoprotein with Yx(FWY)xxD motif
MDHTRHIGRCIVVGVGALVLSGAGIASATTPPTEPPGDTAMATDTAAATDTAMAATGAGPSDCPAITEEAPSGSEPMTTEGAAAAPATTESMTSEAPAATTGESMAPAESVAAVSGPFVQVAESDEYGPILVDSACRSLYGFAQDVDGEPTCVDDCAANWPPLLTPDASVPGLADELDPTLFVIVEHPEGSQLKVGDWPLYYFAGDAAPGDTNGQGVGGLWWLVGSDGTLLEEATEGTEPTEGSAAPTDTASMTTAG